MDFLQGTQGHHKGESPETKSNNVTRGHLLPTPAQFRQWSMEICKWDEGRSAWQVRTKPNAVPVWEMCEYVHCPQLQTCSPLSFNMCVGGFQGSLSSFLKVRGFQHLQPFQIPKYSQNKHWLTEKQSEPIIPLAWLFNGVWQPSLFSLAPH